MRAAERVFVGLGANLGDTRAVLQQALEAIGALPGTRLLARSSIYRSSPVDASGPDFMNVVAEIATDLEPLPLLQALQAIEQAHGRLRPFRNAPRTLDLDLLLFGRRSLHTDVLTLPHPRGHQRAFVLRPLTELAPDLEWPEQGPVAALADELVDQPVERLD